MKPSRRWRGGQIDLAAIGRPLTEEEKTRGLQQAPISRHKIAIIVSPQNPVADITLEQFAQIFRGEIKNWSEVGGPAGEIVVVDRPETSDTRRSFGTYPIFQSAPLKTGDNAEVVTEDDTEMVVQKLGKNGISYAIIDQVKDRQDVKIVPMNKVLPSDPRYPFSQPLAYAFKGPNPSPQVKAFLCFANTTDYAAEDKVVSAEFCGDAVAAAPPETAPAETAPAATPAPTAPAAGEGGAPGWLPWLALLPLLGLLAWFLGKKEPVAAPLAAGAVADSSRLILTPRSCRQAYAYWEVPQRRLQELRDQGGQQLSLRLYDVTDNPQTPVFKAFEVKNNEPDYHLPIERDDRDYKAELGYVKASGEWLPIATSAPVRVPACEPVVSAPTASATPAVLPSEPWGEIEADMPAPAPLPPVTGVNPAIPLAAGLGAGALGLGAAAAAGLQRREPEPSRIILAPRDAESAYAYWEIAEADEANLKNQGIENLTLKIHDVTGIDLNVQPAHNVQEYAVALGDPDQQVPITAPDRDYLAEIGHTAADGRWVSLAKSTHIHFPAPTSGGGINPALAVGGAGLLGGAAALAGGLFDKGKDAVSGGVEAVRSTGENLTAGAANLGERGAEGGQNLLGNTTDFLGGLLDKGKEAVAGGVDAVRSTGENLTAGAANLGERGAEGGQNLLGNTTDFLGGLLDKGKEAVAGGVEAARSTGENLTAGAANLGERGAEGGQNLLENATDFFGGLLDKGKEAASGGAEAVRSTGENLTAGAANLGEQIGDTAQSAGQKVRDSAERLTDADNPQ
jgi:phosphate transport system substrate-binding protein